MRRTDERRYIHYGHKTFDRARFMPISNHEFLTKPYGGLWASRTDAEWGWKDWCKAEDFVDCREENSFRFTLAQGARVLELRSKADLAGLPRQKKLLAHPMCLSLDFEALDKNGVDAIELLNSRALYWELYGWDCDSILVMNPDVIVEE